MTDRNVSKTSPSNLPQEKNLVIINLIGFEVVLRVTTKYFDELREKNDYVFFLLSQFNSYGE